MKILLAIAFLLGLQGCSIMDKSDRFGASIDLGIGGLVGSIVDLRFKADVGFSKTCWCEEKRRPDSPAAQWKEETDAAVETGGDADPRPGEPLGGRVQQPDP